VPFDKKHGLCYKLSYDFDPSAGCPKYEEFLARCVPHIENQMILEEYAGYIFVNKLNFEKILFLYGMGANGKSVWLAGLEALLGVHNVTRYGLESITKKPEYRAKLAEGLLNICTESVTSLKIDVFKQIASREPLECRRLYENPFTLTDYSRQIFSTNVMPKTTEATEGYFRRFLPIPFDTFIPLEERNFSMNTVGFWEESGELPGILNKVIGGLQRLVQNAGFTKSQSSDNLLEEYKHDSDSTQTFIRDEEWYKSDTERIKLKELYSSYRSYCHENGCFPVSCKTLAQRLRNQGFVVTKGTGNVNYVRCSKTVNDKLDWQALYSVEQ